MITPDSTAVPSPQGLTTGLNRAAHAVLESEERFESYADALPLLVWAAGPEGQVNFSNRRCVEYSGVESREKFGQGWTEFVHPDDLPGMGAKWFASIQTGQPFEAEYRLKDAAGRYRWFLGRALPVRDAQGTIARWIGSATDIEEQKQALQIRDDTLAIVSHDLRGPLAAIGLQSALIQRYAQNSKMSGDDKILQGAASIQRQVERMSLMISNLLDAGKIQAGLLVMDLQPLTVLHLIREALEMVEAQLSEKNIEIKFKNLSDASAQVNADEGRLCQVLINLLGNAIKFSPKSGRITIETRLSSEGVRISIIDQGPGISPELIAKLFDRYWQGEEKNSHSGAGLGLFIAKGITEAHRGTIQVQSELGHGSTFSVTIPRY